MADRRASLWLVVVLLAAVAFGAAAALLAAPPGAAPTTTGSSFSGQVSFQLVGLGILVFFGAVTVFHYLNGRSNGVMRLGNRVLVTYLVTFLLCVGFILVARTIGPTVYAELGGGPAPGTNGTGSVPGGPNGTGTNQTPSVPLGAIPLAGIQVPGWLVLVAIVVVAVALSAIAVPYAIARSEVRLSRTAAGPPAREEFAEALRALEDPSTTDARTIIVALYAKLLVRVRGSFERLDVMSPREIELACVTDLHLARATAAELTALFEEARYSSHALPAASATRARAALARALVDLDAGPRVGP